jgi:hypothetical protein
MSGGRVVWVDFEDDEWTVVGERIMSDAFGMNPERLTESAGQFRYVRPDQPAGLTDLVSVLMFSDGPADLLIYDGVTEGMHLFGLDPLSQPSAAEWRKRVIRPALRMGTATLSSDHVVKDATARGRFAIGAQHKLAGLTGAQFMLEQVKPFGRGLRGSSRMLITKDRNGGLRGAGQPGGLPGQTHIGDLVGDATEGDMRMLVLFAPMTDERREAVADARVVAAAERVVSVLRESTRALTMKDIRARVTVQYGTLESALAHLETAGQLRIEMGARGSRFYHLIDGDEFV